MDYNRCQDCIHIEKIYEQDVCLKYENYPLLEEIKNCIPETPFDK